MKENDIISLIFTSLLLLCITGASKAGNHSKEKVLEVKLVLTKASLDSFFSEKTKTSCITIDKRKYKAVFMNNLKAQPYKLLDEITFNGENQSSGHYKRIFDHPVFGYNEVNTRIKRPVFSKKLKVFVQYSGKAELSFKKQPKQHFRIQPENSVIHVCRVQTGSNYNLLLITSREDVRSIDHAEKHEEGAKTHLQDWASEIAAQHQIDTNRIRYLPKNSELTGFCRNHHYPLSDLFFNKKKKEQILKKPVLIYYPTGNDQYYIIRAPKVIHKTTHPLGWRENWGAWKLIVNNGKVRKYNGQQNKLVHKWQAKSLILDVKDGKIKVRIEE